MHIKDNLMNQIYSFIPLLNTRIKMIYLKHSDLINNEEM